MTIRMKINFIETMTNYINLKVGKQSAKDNRLFEKARESCLDTEMKFKLLMSYNDLQDHLRAEKKLTRIEDQHKQENQEN